MNEAFNEFEKKLNDFFEKYCFTINKETGEKELTLFGAKLFIYLIICLYVSKLKMIKNENEVKE